MFPIGLFGPHWVLLGRLEYFVGIGLGGVYFDGLGFLWIGWVDMDLGLVLERIGLWEN